MKKFILAAWMILAALAPCEALVLQIDAKAEDEKKVVGFYSIAVDLIPEVDTQKWPCNVTEHGLMGRVKGIYGLLGETYRSDANTTLGAPQATCTSEGNQLKIETRDATTQSCQYLVSYDLPKPNEALGDVTAFSATCVFGGWTYTLVPMLEGEKYFLNGQMDVHPIKGH